MCSEYVIVCRNTTPGASQSGVANNACKTGGTDTIKRAGLLHSKTTSECTGALVTRT